MPSKRVLSAKTRLEAVTDFIGEPEVQKLLRLAETADVTLDTRMESEYRRVIAIKSSDMNETR